MFRAAQFVVGVALSRAARNVLMYNKALIGCASVMWLLAALLVAFPIPIFKGETYTVFNNFVPNLHFVFIPILIIVDALIAIYLLSDFKVFRKLTTRPSLLSFLLTLLTIMVVISAWSLSRDTIYGYEVYLTLLLLFLYATVRSSLYVRDPVAMPVQGIPKRAGDTSEAGENGTQS